jgi:hypothetical protein
LALAVGIDRQGRLNELTLLPPWGSARPKVTLSIRIKLIEELPMATSAELYQLSWVIEQLFADQRYIVQVRAQLHSGHQVQFVHRADRKLCQARVVGIHGDHGAVLDATSNKAFKLRGHPHRYALGANRQ